MRGWRKTTDSRVTADIPLTRLRIISCKAGEFFKLEICLAPSSYIVGKNKKTWTSELLNDRQNSSYVYVDFELEKENN